MTLTGTLFGFFFASAPGTATRPVTATTLARAVTAQARRRVPPAAMLLLK